MATNFPTGLDSLTNPTSSDSLSNPSHSGQHANANDAIEAIQAKIGVNGSAVTSSLDYKITQVEGKYVDKTLVDAKGDLLVGTAADTLGRVIAGADGTTLIADSTQTAGVRWGNNFGFTAGKNAIINGDFRVNQRAFTSTTTNAAYGFDRWSLSAVDGTTTYSAQTFTAGSAPVAGYEGVNFARIVSTGQTLATATSALVQKIEDVRRFAGRTVTISFWARAGAGTPNIYATLAQDFGSGGSALTYGTTTEVKKALSTSWQRFSFVTTLPSLSGKTIGTNNSVVLTLWTSAGTNLNSVTNSLGIQSATVDFWGVQVETGSVATDFQTATATIDEEIAACQRYYYRITPTAAGQTLGVGFNTSTTQAFHVTTFPVPLRIAPTAIEQSGTAGNYSVRYLATNSACTSVPTHDSATTDSATYVLTTSAVLTAGQGSFARAVNTSAWLAWSAEL